MHLKTRTWFLISLLCFVLAGYFWHLAREERRHGGASNPPPGSTPIKSLGANNFHHSPPLLSSLVASSNAQTAKLEARTPPLLTNRLSNTSKSLNELMRSDTAVLLRNALIDTAVTDPLGIPPHLRAGGDPGAYVVQARGPVDDAFRARLKAAGGSIISYIPNNAYLVRLTAAGADQMRAAPETQGVLGWEPYYKLDLRLLALAVNNQPMPAEAKLNVVVFPGEREAGLEAMKALGAELLGEDRSPFGHSLIVQAPPTSLAALAALPSVHLIQPYHPRQLVNDTTRPRIGVATNSATAPNHLGLDGTGVTVDVNDSGIDAGHPDFDTRVTGDTAFATQDYDGHGTHVAGTIAGSGAMSSSVGTAPPGSDTNGWNFRGMAPKAKLFVSAIDLITGPIIGDSYLQETAAGTNAFISNNSWGYLDSLDYDTSAASYDAAVRDANPRNTGPEPVLFVFAAGNSGEGSSGGQGGQPESIGSPGTAKNVITVGAFEKFRAITNKVVSFEGTNTTTNAVFMADTDSDDQVAFFSSRGNAGVGLEGLAGRFKPDVMAPGTFVISTRSSHWTDPTESGNVILNRLRGEVVKAGTTNLYDVTIPGDGFQLVILTRSNAVSPNPFPALPISVKAGSAPDPVADLKGYGVVSLSVTPGQWFFAVQNPGTTAVNLDVETVIFTRNTNTGNYFAVLKELNDALKPWYRYESGTSQATPAVSGMLALMQQFFETKLGLTRDQNWPALMKAMVISGARSVSDQYYLQVQNSINYQGWGAVSLTNSLPPAMNAGRGSENTWPMAFFHTNTLYTGQSHTRTVTMTARGQAYPLRFTLVWTDPPGNPAASVKLVNDLDLIVSNNISGEVYIGNNIPQGSDFNDVTDPADTNAPAIYDLVNNVENVFINRPVGSSYTVTVRARRVNVNAVNSQTNGILQDYALVIASDNSLLTNTLAVTDIASVPQLVDVNQRFLKRLTNEVPLIHERVGANTPETQILNNGVTNQWNFYVYQNTTSFTNVAFLTFLAPNLSRSRDLEADIDLYVSDQPGLTNLDAAVVADAINWRNGGRSARTRGGTELIIYTNARPGRVFYLGVKAEDQQAAEFGIYAVASDSFGGRDANGNVRLNFTPLSAIIPDGSPESPQAVEMFAIVADPANIRRVVLTNTITHEAAGDLFGVLSHPPSPRHVVLNNHRSFTGTQTFIYDDSGEGDVPFSQPPDGPGRLKDFMGAPAAGIWRFTMIDNAQYHTGRVDRLVGSIEPEEKLTNPNGIILTAKPRSWKYASVDIPFNVTNILVFVEQQPPNPLPLELYLRMNVEPTPNNYDKHATIFAPGGSLSFGINDSPGLQPGNTCFIGVFNPSFVLPVTFRLHVEFQYNLSPIASHTYLSQDTPKALIDDATTNSYIVVTNNRSIADVKVGVRIDHPRLADLVLHLVSPQGTRILLSENRGGPAATNYGFGLPTTYVFPFDYDGDFHEVRTNIDTGQKAGVVRIDYDFFQVPDNVRIYYDGHRIFDSGYVSGAGTFSISYGPGLSTVVSIVMNEGGSPYPTTKWQYTATVTGPWNYATFTENANLGPDPIKFALPPYYTFPTNRMVLSNSFEGVDMATNRTNFARPDTFAGWQVISNGVGLFSDTNHVAEGFSIGFTNFGTNYLALSSGQVSLPFTNLIVPDRDYVLSFAQRKVSSSPTQSVEVQVAPTANLYSYLVVSNAPVGASMSDPQKALKVRLCPGQEVQVQGVAGSQGDTNSMVLGLPKYALIGCFSLLPEMLTSNTVAGSPFLIGTNAVVRAPTDPGDYYLFLGINNDNFDNPPPMVVTNAGFIYPTTSSWQQCQYASAQAVLGATPIEVVGSADWKVESTEFLANPTITNLVLKPGLNTTMEFDAVEIDELISTIYYQPEESMAPFQGEAALGQWRLEVWDNRAGPSQLDTGSLFSWTLHFVFADSPAAVPLTNGVPYTNSVQGDQIKYFVVQVPKEVTMATNFAISTGPGSGGVELLYSPFGLPTGQSPPDPLPGISQAAMPFTLTTTNPVGAELPLGQPYYLGVRNLNPAENNNFLIQVDFNVLITPLVSGVPLVGEVAAPNPNSFAVLRGNTPLAVTNMNYYYLDVPSNDVVSASFSVTPLDGDVNLVLRRALPAADLFPRPTFFDYESTQPFLNSELILVNSNSLPVNLAPGRWYLGVYSTVPDLPVTYDIVATGAKASLWQYTDVTNNAGIPFNGVASTDPLTNFYRLVVNQTNSGVAFSLCGLSDDADLIIKRGDLPGAELYDFSMLQRGTNGEVVILRTNLFIPDVNATNWFVGILGRGFGPVSGVFRATVLNSNDVFCCDCVSNVFVIDLNGNSCGPTNIVATNQVDYYRFTVSPTAYQVDFKTLGANGNVDLYVGKGGTTPPSWPDSYYFYSSTNSGTNDELVTVRTNQLPVAITNGDWFLAVVNQDAKPVTYSVCVTQQTNALAILLTNAIPYTNSIPFSNVVDYYEFDVSSNAIQANFEILHPSGNVDLFLIQGVPLQPTNLLYSSSNPGTNNEFLAVATNSLPYPLTAGPWYMAVVSRETNAVTYAVRVTEIFGPDIIRLTNAITRSNTVAAPAGLTNFGIDYYVFTVSTNAIQATFETFGAVGNVDLYVSRGLPLPGTNSVPFSANGGTSNELVAVFTNSTPVALGPGDWYLAVVNRETTNVAYQVRASEILAADIVRLTNALTRTDTVGAGGSVTNLGTKYFVFGVSTNAIQATFETLQMRGNVDLYLRKGLPLPGATQFDYASVTPGLTNESILVLTNSAPVPLSPGDWYLAVVNREITNVAFQVRATEVLAPNIIHLTNKLAYTNVNIGVGLTNLGIDYYVITVPTNGVLGMFEILNPKGNVDLYVRRGLPLPGTTQFDYASTNPSTNNEFIGVNTGTAPVPLAPGDWYLAVVNKAAASVSYAVRATIIDSSRIVRLTNGLSYCKTAVPYNATNDAIDYYLYTVATNAVQVTIETYVPAVGDQLDLYVKKGLPLPGPASFDYYSGNFGNPSKILVLTNNAPPPLRPLSPGDWYMAAINPKTNSYTYCVKVTEVKTPDIIRLSNGVSYPNTITPADGTNSIGINYYVYTVTGFGSAVFETFGADGDVDIYIKKGMPLPNPPNANYRSMNPGTTDENVLVTPGSSPVPMSTGDWYIAVIGQDPGPVHYSVRVTEVPNTFNPKTLVNHVPVTDPILNAGINYYKYTVSTDAVQTTFETYGANGNVDLYLRKNLPAPNATNFVYKSANAGIAPELILVHTNSSPLALSAGDWYLAVINRESSNVTYTVRVTEIRASSMVRLTNGLPYAGRVAVQSATSLGIDYYIFTVSPDALQASFTTFGANGNVDLFLGMGTPLADRAGPISSSQPGTAAESILLRSNGIPVGLAPGDWFIAVANQDAGPVNYTVCAGEFAGSTDIVALTNGVSFAKAADINCALPQRIDYYSFNVSTGAVRGQFEVINSSSPMELVLRHGGPLPDPSSNDASATNLVPGNVLISLYDTSVPVPLSAGAWYLGVVYLTGNSARYSVTATEFFGYGTNVHIASVSVSASSNLLCFTISNCLPAMSYVLVGKTNLSDAVWQVASPAITAAGSKAAYCLPLSTTPYHFFTVQETSGVAALSGFDDVIRSVTSHAPEWAEVSGEGERWLEWRPASIGWEGNPLLRGAPWLEGGDGWEGFREGALVLAALLRIEN